MHAIDAIIMSTFTTQTSNLIGHVPFLWWAGDTVQEIMKEGHEQYFFEQYGYWMIMVILGVFKTWGPTRKPKH